MLLTLIRIAWLNLKRDRVAQAHARIRQEIDFQRRDRAMDGDVRRITALVASGSLDSIASRAG